MTTEHETIETQCAGCGRVLRVPTAHSGKQARCPVCGNISIIPGVVLAKNRAFASSTLPPPDLGAPSSPRGWSMRTPEGQIYGPIPRSELDQWVADGRVTSECELQEGPIDAEAATSDASSSDSISGGESHPWLAADRLYPQLRPVVWTPPQPTSQAAASSLGHAPRPSQYSPAIGLAGMRATYVTPHRGGMILILGILGIAVGCPIFSLMAWVMGSSDLRDMRAGRMDRSGEGVTQVGCMLGAVLSMLWIGGFVLATVIILIAAARS